jgi:hypothetical protein
VTHPLTTVFLVGALCAAISGVWFSVCIALLFALVLEGFRFYKAGQTDGLG